MTSKVSIVNQALLRCGHYNQIEQLDWGNPETPEEMLATRFYDNVRRECLTMGPWNFAESEVALVGISDWEETLPWPYAYAYPSDCVMARQVNNLYTAKPIKFAIGLHKSGPSSSPTKIIKTKVAGTTLTYTNDLDMPDYYAPAFNSMFSWKLALAFGQALGLNEKQLSTVLNGFNNDRSAALTQNAIEMEDDYEDSLEYREGPDWLEARDMGYGRLDTPEGGYRR